MENQDIPYMTTYEDMCYIINDIELLIASQISHCLVSQYIMAHKATPRLWSIPRKMDIE